MNCVTLRAQGIPINEVTYVLKSKQKINQKTNISESEDLLSLFGTKGTGARFFNISLEVQVLGANAILNVACFHNIFYL